MRRLLDGKSGDSLLDVGRGTGWTTHRIAAEGLVATELDPNPGWLDFARAHGDQEPCVEGNALSLPFGGFLAIAGDVHPPQA